LNFACEHEWPGTILILLNSWNPGRIQPYCTCVLASSAGNSLAKIGKSIMNNSKFKVRGLYAYHSKAKDLSLQNLQEFITFTFLPIFLFIILFLPKSCLRRKLRTCVRLRVRACVRYSEYKPLSKIRFFIRPTPTYIRIGNIFKLNLL
jgi:hypothetical protein